MKKHLISGLTIAVVLLSYVGHLYGSENTVLNQVTRKLNRLDHYPSKSADETTVHWRVKHGISRIRVLQEIEQSIDFTETPAHKTILTQLQPAKATMRLSMSWDMPT